MAGSVNKAILIGHLGKDPEMKYSANGTQWTRFTLATNESYKNEKGEKVEKTDWHNITAFGKLAEICHTYLKKGSKIYCEGRITYSTAEKDGVKQYFTSIIMSDLQMLDRKGDSGEANYSQTANNPAPPEQGKEPEGDDDLPF